MCHEPICYLPTLAKAAWGQHRLLKRLGAAQDHGSSTFATGTRRLCWRHADHTDHWWGLEILLEIHKTRIKKEHTGMMLNKGNRPQMALQKKGGDFLVNDCCKLSIKHHNAMYGIVWYLWWSKEKLCNTMIPWYLIPQFWQCSLAKDDTIWQWQKKIMPIPIGKWSSKSSFLGVHVRLQSTVDMIHEENGSMIRCVVYWFEYSTYFDVDWARTKTLHRWIRLNKYK